MFVICGPLAGFRWYAGYNPGPGKGLSVCLNRYEPESLAVAALLATGVGCALDIGAHSGLYSLLFARVAPLARIYAFEPLPENVQRLQRTLRGNGLQDRVRVVPAAVGARDGLMGFRLGPETSMGRLDAAGEQPVVVVRLDDFCTRFGLRPEVIKIDVEGAELQVLEGGAGTLRALKPKLLLSTHSPDLHAACAARLRELGYAKLETLGADTLIAQ